jgi:hypothetical protein
MSEQPDGPGARAARKTAACPAELRPPTRTISRPSHRVASIVVAQYETLVASKRSRSSISGRR